MKSIISLILPVGACIGMVSCESLNKPLSGSDSFNPLDGPGTAVAAENSDPYGPAFTPGTFLQTVSPSTSFFKAYPKDNDQPTKILADYTDVKVVSSKGSYVKVEVVDTGDVGYVPSVMLGEKRAPEDIPDSGSPTDVPGEVAPDPVAPSIEPPTASGVAPAAPATDPAADTPSAPATAPEPKSKGIEPPKVVEPSE
ncbi:MAG: hypothetical protein AB8F34_00910 [Akkermansiaceae bacterium]